MENFAAYRLENHHHALADAEACAWIAIGKTSSARFIIESQITILTHRCSLSVFQFV